MRVLQGSHGGSGAEQGDEAIGDAHDGGIRLLTIDKNK
jgi:hypothetical protein